MHILMMSSFCCSSFDSVLQGVAASRLHKFGETLTLSREGVDKTAAADAVEIGRSRLSLGGLAVRYCDLM